MNAHDRITHDFAQLDWVLLRTGRGEIEAATGCAQASLLLKELFALVLDELVKAHVAGQDTAEDRVAERLGGKDE